MRVLVCGDRNWTDKEVIRSVLKALKPKPELVICGGARGADTLAKEVAIELGLKVVEFPANWALNGKAAGPMRNQKMLVEGQPTFVIAFHDDIKASKGTAHMLFISRYNKIRTQLYTTKGPVND
jgi:hypothetical protein